MCSRSPPLSGLYRPLLCVFETEAVGHGTAIDRLMALASPTTYSFVDHALAACGKLDRRGCDILDQQSYRAGFAGQQSRRRGSSRQWRALPRRSLCLARFSLSIWRFAQSFHNV